MLFAIQRHELWPIIWIHFFKQIDDLTESEPTSAILSFCQRKVSECTQICSEHAAALLFCCCSGSFVENCVDKLYDLPFVATTTSHGNEINDGPQHRKKNCKWRDCQQKLGLQSYVIRKKRNVENTEKSTIACLWMYKQPQQQNSTRIDMTFCLNIDKLYFFFLVTVPHTVRWYAWSGRIATDHHWYIRLQCLSGPRSDHYCRCSAHHRLFHTIFIVFSVS